MNPFAAASSYRKLGWTSPLLLPHGKKYPPLKGYTSVDAAVPSREDIERWNDAGGGNIGLHYGPTQMAIDVDDHDDKNGAEELLRLLRKLGPLPRTWRNTSRGKDSPHGHYLFRIPAGRQAGMTWEKGEGGCIDILREGHRYSVVAPSTNPDDAASPYRWVRPDGSWADDGEYPSPAALPQLPEAWLNYLSPLDSDGKPKTHNTSMRNVDLLEADAWLGAHPATGTEGDADHTRVLATFDLAVRGARRESLNAQTGELGKTTAHDATHDGLIRLCRHVEQGHFGAAQAITDLRPIFVQTISDRSARVAAETEFDSMLAWAVTLVSGDPIQRREIEQGNSNPFDPAYDERWNDTRAEVDEATGELRHYDADGNRVDDYGLPWVECDEDGRVAGEPLDVWFSSLEPRYAWLRNLRQYARANAVSPVATLGVHLTRVISAIGTDVVTPQLVGGTPGSLNAFCCLLGDPGSNKGATSSAGENCCDITHQKTVGGVVVTDGPIYARKIGSGQGCATQYARRPTAKTGELPPSQVRQRDQVHFVCPEVSDFISKSSGSSTLMSTCCEMFMAETLGSAYTDPTKDINVPALSYRATFELHGQPELMAPVLIEGAKQGVPHRFLFLDVIDSHQPSKPPLRPERLNWSPPRYERRGSPPRLIVTLPAEAEFAVRRHNRLKSARLVDPLDSHLLFARIKYAVAVAFRSGDSEVLKSDWDLVTALFEQSALARAAALARLAAQKKADRTNSLLAKADDAVAVAAALDQRHVAKTEASVQQTAEKIMKRLTEKSPKTRRELRLEGTDNINALAALDFLIESKQIVAVDVVSPGNHRTTTEFRIA